MEKSNEEIVSEYYNKWEEQYRLTRDNAHMTEYYITMEYIEKCLTPNNKILELGCGTGIYSLELAKKGYDVTAMDISNKNLELLRKSIRNNMKIHVFKGNAIDLSKLTDSQYDISLMLGPLYHLFSLKDIEKSINEMKRVTKKGGYIFLSFLSQDYIMMRKCTDIFDNPDRYLNTEYNYKCNLDEAFYYFKINDFENLMLEHLLPKKYLLTTDGITGFIEEKVSLSNEGYQHYLNYLKKNCERKELLGFSPHLLYITQKI